MSSTSLQLGLFDRSSLAPPIPRRRAQKPSATAPEHTYVDPNGPSIEDVIISFDELYRSQFADGYEIHHLFDPPSRRDVMRLAKKAQACPLMTPEQAASIHRDWQAHAHTQRTTPAIMRENSSKTVLSFFDYTGQWSQPWEDAGYNVYRFDIQADPDSGDVMKFSTEFFSDWFADFDGQEIYAILTANPCTDFAGSGSRHFANKDADGRTVASIRLLHRTLEAIEYFKPSIWALENPVGRIESLGGLPPWRLGFDPCHLGHPYTKKTLIWGRFNQDLPITPVDPVEGSKMHKKYGGSSMATKNARSETPLGFAYGFFMANNAHDHPHLSLCGRFDRLDPNLIRSALDAGHSPDDISTAIEDLYYMEMDDAAAETVLRDMITPT